MEKVFIVGYDGLIERMMATKGYQIVGEAALADIVIFTGGADVSPEFYGALKHPTTGCDPRRDDRERIIHGGLNPNQLKVGICRGSQFLCVMNGGSLYQDVDKHAIWGTHRCFYMDEKKQVTIHDVTSTHHQMQNPFTSDKPFELWGTASRCTYRDSEKVERKLLLDAHEDVEIVFWPESNTLGFQGHPEYDSKECRELFFICLNRALKRLKD